MHEVAGILQAGPPISLRSLAVHASTPQTLVVEVQTGTVDRAGTDARVFISLFGSWDAWVPDQQLGASETNANPLERGQLDRFRFMAGKIGVPDRIIISHDQSGHAPSWFVDHINVFTEVPNGAWPFPVHRWLSSDPGIASDCACSLQVHLNGPAIPTPLIPHPCAGTGGGGGGSPPGGGSPVQQFFFCVTPPGSGGMRQTLGPFLATSFSDAEAQLLALLPDGGVGFNRVPGPCPPDIQA